MIIGAYEPHRPGEIFRDTLLKIKDGRMVFATGMIMKEVTREDWIRFCEEEGASISGEDQPTYFYEISVD